jgi:quercetin dioxygenase-like cupin family protein
MSGYGIVRLEDIDEISDGREPWRPVRHTLGIRAFGVSAWTGKQAGDRIINEHDEADDEQEELYVVTQGRAVFEIDGERHEADAGTFVFVRPGVKRTAFAEEPGTTLVAVGSVPGKAYEPHGYDVWAPLKALYDAGDYAGVADAGRESIEAAEYPDAMYNLACCESLAGRKEDALRHLRRSIELSERFRTFAKGDSDFDAIRDEPAFEELVEAS